MKIVETDLYTKIVLTVIAACLLFSAFKSVLAPREATAEGPQPVYVEGGYVTVDGTVDVEKVRSNVTVDGTIDVNEVRKEVTVRGAVAYTERGYDLSDVVNVRVVNQ